jgi:SAM-dependent methyltransferase
VGVEHGLSEATRASLAADGVTAYRGLYEELELPEAPFDLVVAQQVVEHATEPAELLAKVRRELAPGGFVVLDTPDYESLDRRLFQRGSWGGYHFPRHMTIFTAGSLARLARQEGFDVVRTVKLVSPVFWVLSLQNLLRGAGAPAPVADLAHYQSLPLLGAATAIDLVSLATTGATSNLRLVLARRP